MSTEEGGEQGLGGSFVASFVVSAEVLRGCSGSGGRGGLGRGGGQAWSRGTGLGIIPWSGGTFCFAL